MNNIWYFTNFQFGVQSTPTQFGVVNKRCAPADPSLLYTSLKNIRIITWITSFQLIKTE